MNKILNCKASKAICAVVVALGAFAASAELVKTPILQTFEDENGTVTESVGYKVTGLPNDEIAMVYTNHLRTATWTVPATLKNVQFLVVGGGGGGAGGDTGNYGVPGGGGGGVVTGAVFSLSEKSVVSVIVGNGGKGGIGKGTSVDNVTSDQVVIAENGGDSKFLVDNTLYVTAPGGGGDKGSSSSTTKKGGKGGSNSGSRTDQVATWDSSLFYTNSTYITASIFGNPGGKANGTGPASAGGGGGALEAGYPGTASPYKGGNGGAGLTNLITGVKVVYGSGGGGGESFTTSKYQIGGTGGAGAGDGGAYMGEIPAKSGLANQGGGGGGGFRRVVKNVSTHSNGGNGGSGIVVFRYVEPVTAVAQIGDTEYASLGAALEAATAGAMITVLNDIATDAAFVITKKVTIDLNGKTIAATQADTEGNGVFWVKTNGELTLNGEGTVNGVGGNKWNIGIFAENGGKVIINGGTYTNEGAQDDGPDGDHFDLIYVKNGGAVEINGGTFKCETPNWTLNSHDTKKGTIVVKGGTFYQFNPSDCATEGAGTNFCADGYAAELNNEGYYVVVKLAIAPNGATEVTASSSDDAASKVTILVPDAMKDVVTAVKYAEYFVKSAEYNASTGKYTVTAALNPDVVKPVIAETEGDTTKEAFVIDAKGNVTLNISNKKPGLYYGVQVLAELGADPVAVVAETNGSLLVPAENLPNGNAAFFKVVVDFAPIPTSKAE